MSERARLGVNLAGGLLLSLGLEELFVSFGIVSPAGGGSFVAAAVAGLGPGLLRHGGPPRVPD